MRKAQAMLETLFAMLAILAVFAGAFLVVRKLAAKTVLDHAAARAARARAVGFNDFMCRKSALAAMIPVSGERLVPDDASFDEASRVPVFLSSEDRARAAAILDYANWHSSSIDIGTRNTLLPVAETRIDMWTDDFHAAGSASVESHCSLYMFDGGR